MRIRTLIAILLFPFMAFAQNAPPTKKPQPAFAQIEDVGGLPRVLLIGDSISIGYTLAVREALKGVANVHRPAANCGPSSNGIERVDSWLGTGKWDVIHFNFGLHDLKYVDDKNQLTDVTTAGARPQVPVEVYAKNLETIIGKLKATGAKVIWCSTTPVPPGSKGRVAGDEVKYNEAAAKVAAAQGIGTDDLYTFAQPKLAEIQLPANVHFSPAGSKVLAEQVSSSIRQALGK